MIYIHYRLLALTVFIISSLGYAQIEVWSLNNQSTHPYDQRTNPLGIEIFLDKDSSGENVPNYQLNEKIKIGVRLSASSYLYLFHLNSQGNTAQIFPNKYDQNNFLRGNETVYIPNSTRYSLRISGPEGLDHVVAIASKHPLEGHKITFDDYFEGHKPKYPSASFWASDVTQFWLGNHKSVTTVTPDTTSTTTSTNAGPSSPSASSYQNPSSVSKTEIPEPSTTFTNTEPPKDELNQTTTSLGADNQIITIAPSKTAVSDQVTTSPSTDNQIITIAPSQENVDQTRTGTSQSAAESKDYQVYAGQNSYSKWQTANIQDYSFIFKQECYCTEEYLKAMYVVVRDGKVSSVTYHEDNQAVPENVFASVLTLGELLEGTSEVEKNIVAKVEGEYDKDFGFPKKLFIDNDINVASVNDEISYEVSFFRVESDF